jgi:hypothetical protein
MCRIKMLASSETLGKLGAECWDYWYVRPVLALRRRLSGLPCALSTPTSLKKYPCVGDEFRDAGPSPHLD